MPKKFWWANALADQLIQVQNFKSKITGVGVALGLTPAQITAAVALCDAFIGAFNATDQAKQTMQSMTQWREVVFYGTPLEKAAPQAPVFAVVGATTYTRGVVTQFFALRDLIVALPNYTVNIGEDLGIVGTEITPKDAVEVSPSLKTVTSTGYWVNLTGSMSGMDGMRIEYAPKGGNFSTVAFLTNTPGGFQVTPVNPNLPEMGHIRAIYIKRNEVFGNYSPDYPVTLS